MSISIIVATDLNNGIGKDNKLLYHIEDDLKRFKELTSNHIIIMGRKTYESLPNKKPLIDRFNIVITNKDTGELYAKYNYSDLIFTNFNKDEIQKLKECNKEIFIIGGESIYKMFLPYTDKIYLTRIYEENNKADTYFEIPYGEFKYDYISPMMKTDNNIYYKFINLIRK